MSAVTPHSCKNTKGSVNICLSAYFYDDETTLTALLCSQHSS